MHVLIVCEANRMRSPLAEALLTRELAARCATDVTVSSAGIHARGDEPARSTLRTLAAEHGLDLSGHVSRPLDAALVADAELILTMTREQADHIGMHHPGVADRLFLLRELVALLDGADAGAEPGAEPSAEGDAELGPQDGPADGPADGPDPLLAVARAARLVRGLADDDIVDPGADPELTRDLLGRLTADCRTLAARLA